MLYNYPPIVYKVQISINCKKILLEFLVLSIVLALNGNHFVLNKGDNSIEKRH